MSRIDILEKKEFILKCIEENVPKSHICRLLKCKQSTLNSYLKIMNIEYKGNVGGKNFKKGNNKKSVFSYLNNESNIHSYKLKNKLFEEGVKEEKCESCGNTHWMGFIIPLELHHIDGDRFNNNLENLQILCYNCHALTNNFRQKLPDKIYNNETVLEKKNKRDGELKLKKIEKELKKIEKSLNKIKIKSKPRKLTKKCDCGKLIYDVSKRCDECWAIENRKQKQRPTYEELLSDISELKYFKAVGRKYNVSDNTIRKWIKAYENEINAKVV